MNLSDAWLFSPGTARKLRVQYPGAIYHLMNRGDGREPVFKDDQDRRRFLETLGEACAKTGWQVHAYVLMPNHFHLVEAGRTEEPIQNEKCKIKNCRGAMPGEIVAACF